MERKKLSKSARNWITEFQRIFYDGIEELF